MRRDEAVTTLREISDVCTDVSAISLMESKPTNGSTGYQLHIKARPDQLNIRLIKEICTKHNYEIKEENDGFVIYKPKTL